MMIFGDILRVELDVYISDAIDLDWTGLLVGQQVLPFTFRILARHCGGLDDRIALGATWHCTR